MLEPQETQEVNVASRVSNVSLERLQEEVRLAQGGAIKEHKDEWLKLTSDPEILETVSGLPIELVEEAPSAGSFQYPFKAEELAFLDEEINRLLQKRIIVECVHEEGELVSPIFLRPKSDGEGYRMILNLKKLNQVSEYHHFKMDTLKSILTLVTPNIFMTKLDIKDAYYSVPILEEHQKLLKFTVAGKLYKFLVLPNGYTAGPRKFTKLLKPALAKLRQKNITLAAYLDDMFLRGVSFVVCRENLLKVIELLRSLGFTIHPDKTLFEPSQEIEFLGFIINSVTMTVRLTTIKKAELQEFCSWVLSLADTPKAISIRDIAKLLGKITSTFIGVPEGKLHYRKLERAKTEALSVHRGKYERPIHISEDARKEIRWWRDNIMDSFSPIYRGNPTIVLTTDASKRGWGAVVEGDRTGGFFGEVEREMHINILEAMAVLFGLQAFEERFSDSYIKLMVDNTPTVGAINNMGSSKSESLDEIIQEIWRWVLERKSWVIACHIPGRLNTEADEESRRSGSKTEWMLNPELFQYVVKELGFSPVVDLFASRLNKQLPIFFSFRPDPEASAIDAFAMDWGELDFYAFPPFICVGRVLHKVQMDKAKGVIVVPDWPNQCWYQEFKSMVIKDILLPPRDDMLLLPMDSSIKHPLRNHLHLRAALVSATDL